MDKPPQSKMRSSGWFSGAGHQLGFGGLNGAFQNTGLEPNNDQRRMQDCSKEA